MKYLKYYESSFSNKTLAIINDHIDELQELHEGLEKLDCFGNNLIKLPKLPDSLKYLDCENNKLIELPKLPDGLIELFCNNNNLKELTVLPSNLKNLDCRHNKLKELPELPDSLERFRCWDNNFIKPIPIKYMDKFFLDDGYYEMEDVYTLEQIEKFSSFEFQKEFLDEDESRWQDLIPSEFNDKLKNTKHAWVLNASDMGLL